MVPPLNDRATGTEQTQNSIEKTAIEESIDGNDVQVSFSHIQLYADHIEDVKEYKDLEDSLNEFASHWAIESQAPPLNDEGKTVWTSLNPSLKNDQVFTSEKRDVVKQLLVGFGFRVTGYRYPDESNQANTRSLLVTSRDPNGVQIVVTAIDESVDKTDDYHHFDSGMFGVCFLVVLLQNHFQTKKTRLSLSLFFNKKIFADSSKVIQIDRVLQFWALRSITLAWFTTATKNCTQSSSTLSMSMEKRRSSKCLPTIIQKSQSKEKSKQTMVPSFDS